METTEKSSARALHIEKKLILTISRFLSNNFPIVSEGQARFLCEPWVHFFTHSSLHRIELWNEQISNLIDKPTPYELTPPGDSLAFFEYVRSTDYSQYIDASLNNKVIKVKCRTEVQQLHLPAKNNAITVCFKPCFPRSFRYFLKIFSLGKIYFLPNNYKYTQVQINIELRQRLENQIKLDLEAEEESLAGWFARRVTELFPRSILENLVGSYQSKQNLRNHRALYSADAWHIIDEWKIYAISQKNKGDTKWIGCPNAVSHGCLAVFWQRDFELQFMDIYLTWGWKSEPNSNKNEIPFHPPHQAGRRIGIALNTNKKSEILISTAARPKHLLEYPYTPNKYSAYLNTQMYLARQVGLNTGLSVTLRTRPTDMGWNLQKMVDILAPLDIKIEFQSGLFIDRLIKSKIHICDNCSTTIIDSLWANHPTLILLTGDYFLISENRLQEFNILKESNVYFTEPDLLVRHLTAISGDVYSWWRSEKVQSSISKFLHTQGASGGTARKWASLLTKFEDDL